MPEITTQSPTSFDAGFEASNFNSSVNNQENQQRKTANISSIYQNNYTNSEDNLETEPVALYKRTKKVVKTITKLFNNQKIEDNTKGIVDISLLTTNQIEDKIQQILKKKYDEEPSFSHRTDKINDLHILLEKVNLAISAASIDSSNSQSYINGLKNLALALCHLYERLIIPLSLSIFDYQ